MYPRLLSCIFVFLFSAMHIGVRGWGSGGGPPWVWKISGQTLFSGQALVDKKSWIIKNISIQWKIPGPLCFSGQAQVAQKSSWIKKNIYSVQWIQGTLFFQGKRKLLKNPECKKYIQYSKKFQGNSVFMASASCSKILNDKIYISIQWKIPRKLFFRASACC